MEKTTALAEKLRAIADLIIQEADDLRATADLLVEEASEPELARISHAANGLRKG